MTGDVQNTVRISTGRLTRVALLIVFSLVLFTAKADHITGGEMYYTTTSEVNGNIIYSVTLKLFMRCNSGRQFNNPAIVSIFDRGTNTRVNNLNVQLSSESTIRLNDAGPCVTNPPQVCYVIGTYIFNVSLPPSANGYVLSSQVNFRISGISNLTPGYSNIGATYTCEIPGLAAGADAPKNNSAQFTGSDLVVVCANNRFAYSFGATDADKDELRYSFCSAYVSGSSSVGNNSVPPPNPPYSSVPYGSGYNGNGPLGPQVKLDSKTGLITGIAPATGVYVVTVCVEEIRNGVVIATQRKDLQINIANCDIAAASLEPEYQLCRNTKTLSISNLSTSTLIKTQNWSIINPAGTNIFDTTGTALVYTFADTGIYTVKLLINKGQTCSDSTLSLVRVYPGFVPSFSFAGICFSKSTVFNNTTTTVYGAVQSLNWNFGDETTQADTSIAANPSYTYPTMGNKTAILTATNTNGCRDTARRIIAIFDKPPLNLSFKDTLICVSDSVSLRANGTGLYSWTPAANIINANTASPTVFPKNTTRYIVELNDQGCLNKDTVTVRVTDRVNLVVMNDTTICQGDDITLQLQSDAFRYSWTPTANILNPLTPNPTATTFTNTVYEVTANIGSCQGKAQVRVTTVPYPQVFAGQDTMLCFETSGQLHGVTNGNSYKWSPAAYVSNSNILDPLVQPPATTQFVLSAFANNGCPKAGTDTVTIVVLPDINAFAGNDTSIVVGQDLQLQATGGTAYAWSPPIGLSSTRIANPVARYNEPSEGLRYFVYVYNQAGCADTASLFIKVFGTEPTVFVPSAFTPNNDGNNDVLRPIAAGIKKIEYFSVYNRWGQLVFTTSQPKTGWDGTINGKPQASGTFVWMVRAVDYTDKTFVQKGTVVLLR